MNLDTIRHFVLPFRPCRSATTAATTGLELAREAVCRGLFAAIKRLPPSNLVTGGLFLLEVLLQDLEVHLVEVDDTRFAFGCG